jgi:hypothetical protein
MLKRRKEGVAGCRDPPERRNHRAWGSAGLGFVPERAINRLLDRQNVCPDSRENPPTTGWRHPRSYSSRPPPDVAVSPTLCPAVGFAAAGRFSAPPEPGSARAAGMHVHTKDAVTGRERKATISA